MYRYNREENEAVIRRLVDMYPKCFFETPRVRRPLKRNILVDLERAGFRYDQTADALNWYQSHFGYQYALQAGAKRVNLDGREVDTVTELEAAAAQKKIKEGQRLVIERNGHNATKVVAALHAAGRIPDDQLRKLEAPPIPAPSKLKRVQEALAAADAALTGPGDDSLRAALTSAALGVVIKEAQSAIDVLTS